MQLVATLFFAYHVNEAIRPANSRFMLLAPQQLVRGMAGLFYVGVRYLRADAKVDVDTALQESSGLNSRAGRKISREP